MTAASRFGVLVVLIDWPNEGRGRANERRPGVAVEAAIEDFGRVDVYLAEPRSVVRRQPKFVNR